MSALLGHLFHEGDLYTALVLALGQEAFAPAIVAEQLL